MNQTYERQIRDLPITGKEVYLHLSQRQFYCPDCDHYFNERFNFVARQRVMTCRYERYVYECCKANTVQKISAQENLVWETVNQIYQQGTQKELQERPRSKVRAVGMDEFVIKKGHRSYATVIVDLERTELIDILEYREQARLIEYFKGKGTEWCEGIQVFCSDLWLGFINTAQAVFPQAMIILDRFHFFSHLNQAVDRQRKSVCPQFKDHEVGKHLQWALLKNAENLTPHQKNKRDSAFAFSPELKLSYDHKEKFRALFNQRLTRRQGAVELEKWIEEAKELQNKHLNNFLYMLNVWKEYGSFGIAGV